MKIYMIRHGQTDWNVEGRFQGREDIPLNATGMEQAKECGIALKKTGIPFDCVVTSPLGRAYVTAKEIADRINIKEISVEENLTERDFGNISGLLTSQRDEMLKNGEAMDMEPREKVGERMRLVMEKYAATGYQNVIMVSHGGSIRAVLAWLSQGEIDKLILKNTCLCVIDYQQGEFRLKEYNVTANEYLMHKQEKNK